MPALPRVRMGCALSTGVMETSLVAAVRPVAVVLLAVARTEDTGAAAPAGAVDEADVAVPAVLDGAMGAVLLATTCTRCTGAAAPGCTGVEEALLVAVWAAAPRPGDPWESSGAATVPCTGTVPCTA